MRREWERNGLCSQCGKVPPQRGRKSCAGCLSYIGKVMAERQTRLRAESRCVACGEPTNGTARCAVHAKVSRQSRQRLYRHRAKNQLCIGCGKPGYPNLSRCGDCERKREEWQQNGRLRRPRKLTYGLRALTGLAEALPAELNGLRDRALAEARGVELTHQQRRVVQLCWCPGGMTLAEVGQHLGISRERARQIEADAVQRILAQRSAA